MDFQTFGWEKQKNDSAVAKSIRASVHQQRRERGRGGHRFRYSTLKAIWSVGETHAVLNHTDDTTWQYWRNTNGGWLLVSWHLTRREAQASAELPLPADLAIPLRVSEAGLHVYAGWQQGSYTMDVPCSSDEIAQDIKEAFEIIGCHTELVTIG